MTTERRRRLSPKLRSVQILEIAVSMAKNTGYIHLTREDLAAKACVSPALISFYFKSMTHLRHEIMTEAITLGIPEIVAQGLALGDQQARDAPALLKAKAATLLANF